MYRQQNTQGENMTREITRNDLENEDNLMEIWEERNKLELSTEFYNEGFLDDDWSEDAGENWIMNN